MRPLIPLAALAVASPIALADTMTQNLDFTWSGLGPLEVGTFQGFDDMGGSRTLTGVSVAIDAHAQWDLTFSNYSAQAFGTGEWTGEGFVNFNIFLGEFGSGAERIAGFIDFHGVTGELGAGSGDPIFGDPGDPTVSATFSGDVFNFFDLNAAEFGIFDPATVQARILSFTDVVIGGPDGAPGIILAETDMLDLSGALTLTYEYTDVPAPASVTLMTGCALLGARRRR